MKSWKTTSAGLSLIISGVAGLYFAYKTNSINPATITTGTSAIFGGIGLIFAKDSNVTGGTVAQDAGTTTPASK
jgi:hypothetical protein